MLEETGRSIFGAIDQQVMRYARCPCPAADIPVAGAPTQKI
jgi:hypothetical protein